MADHKATLASKVREARTLKAIIGVLVFVIVFLSIIAIKNAGSSTAVLVPFSALLSKSNLKVSGIVDEDVEYLKRLLMSDMQVVANFTPQTLDRNIALLQFRLMPDAWAKFSDEMSRDVEFLKRSRISQVFYPVKTEYVPGARIFRVTGDLVRFSGDQVLVHSVYVYDVKYELVSPYDYRISVLKIYSSDKAPKTPNVEKEKKEGEGNEN